MPAEYFEQRERQLLGERFDTLYIAPTEAAARGATVSALRTDPATFARLCGFPVQVSPFCPQAFVVEQGEDFRPAATPTTMRGCFTRRSHRQLRRRRCWGCALVCGCWTCALHLEAKAVSWQLPCKGRGCW